MCLYDETLEKCVKTYALKKAPLSAGSWGALSSEQPVVRSVALGEERILVGTLGGEVLELDRAGVVTLLTHVRLRSYCTKYVTLSLYSRILFEMLCLTTSSSALSSVTVNAF